MLQSSRRKSDSSIAEATKLHARPELRSTGAKARETTHLLLEITCAGGVSEMAKVLGLTSMRLSSVWVSSSSAPRRAGAAKASGATRRSSVRVFAGGNDSPAARAAARKALEQALGGKRDILASNDGGGGGGIFGGIFGGRGRGGGGGGGGGGGDSATLQTIGIIVAALAVFFGIKPACAVIVNAVYYALRLPTGREPQTVAAAARDGALVAADQDIINKYAGAGEDDD